MFRPSLLPPTIMKVYIPLLLSVSAFLTTTMARTISVANNCPYTICWVAEPTSNVSFHVHDDWVGQIWGRRDCNFTTNPGSDSCLDGGCPGGLLCTGLVGQFKVTHYLVIASSHPSGTISSYYCRRPECSVDLGVKCPTPLQEPFDPPGFHSGCNSACGAGLAPDPDNDPNCCTGEYDSPEICLPSGVQYYSYFKSNCPDTYVYNFDTVNKKAGSSPEFACLSESKADYTVTFCPKKK
ncbi:thaumatin [Lactarius quietus]|nr:thaumatin [Lactarius quietus]